MREHRLRLFAGAQNLPRWIGIIQRLPQLGDLPTQFIGFHSVIAERGAGCELLQEKALVMRNIRAGEVWSAQYDGYAFHDAAVEGDGEARKEIVAREVRTISITARQLHRFLTPELLS